MIKRSENICLDFLLQSCGSDYFFERRYDYKISIYYQIDKFLMVTCEKVFCFCKYLSWEYKCDMVNFCDWCLFYKDIVTYLTNFAKIRLSSNFLKIADVFDLFFWIINYWCSVNKQVVDDFFSLLPTFNHMCL